MWLLTWRDLQYRKLRVLVVVILAGIIMSLLFLMTGLVNQFNHEPYGITQAIPAQQWVLQEGTRGPFTSGGVIPPSAVGELGDTARPVAIGRGGLTRETASPKPIEVMIVGLPSDLLSNTVGRGILAKGRAPQGTDEITIDQRANVSVGEAVRLGGAQMTVVGVTKDTTVLAGVPIVLTDLGTAQDQLFSSREVITAAVVDTAPAMPPAGTIVRTGDQIAANTLVPLKNAIKTIDFVRGLLWVVTAVIIGAVVFLSALERQRDFAILRAMGTPRRSLLVAVALQAVLIAILGAVAAMGLQALIAPRFPMPVRMPPSAFLTIPLGAVVVALVAGAFGLRKVAGADPATAFSGPGA